MRQKPGPPKETSEQLVRDIGRATRKRYSAEEKIRIVLGGRTLMRLPAISIRVRLPGVEKHHEGYPVSVEGTPR